MHHAHIVYPHLHVQHNQHILIGAVFDLLNRICRLKKYEETFCVRDRYTISPTATSFIQSRQVIKTDVLSEKLNNIERLNHVSPRLKIRKPAEFNLYL